jgi:hypothetical protein
VFSSFNSNYFSCGLLHVRGAPPSPKEFSQNDNGELLIPLQFGTLLSFVLRESDSFMLIYKSVLFCALNIIIKAYVLVCSDLYSLFVFWFECNLSVEQCGSNIDFIVHYSTGSLAREYSERVLVVEYLYCYSTTVISFIQFC